MPSRLASWAAWKSIAGSHHLTVRTRPPETGEEFRIRGLKRLNQTVQLALAHGDVLVDAGSVGEIKSDGPMSLFKAQGWEIVLDWSRLRPPFCISTYSRAITVALD